MGLEADAKADDAAAEEAWRSDIPAWCLSSCLSELPSTSPKHRSARFRASVTADFFAFSIAAPLLRSMHVPEPTSWRGDVG